MSQNAANTKKGGGTVYATAAKAMGVNRVGRCRYCSGDYIITYGQVHCYSFPDMHVHCCYITHNTHTTHTHNKIEIFCELGARERGLARCSYPVCHVITISAARNHAKRERDSLESLFAPRFTLNCFKLSS